jgi:hypothetical protein
MELETSQRGGVWDAVGLNEQFRFCRYVISLFYLLVFLLFPPPGRKFIDAFILVQIRKRTTFQSSL